MSPQVFARKDADDPRAVEHRKAAHVVGLHLIESFGERRVGPYTSDVVSHAARDRERPSSLALGSFDVAT
jgi:hypothetical protein